MSAAEVIRSAVRGLSANKLRSGLTVLGILIGVAAVILLVAVGNGSAKAVADRLSALGSNTVTIAATGGRGPQGTQTRSQQLTLDIAHSMKDDVFAPDVLSVSPVQTVSKAVTAGSESVTVTIVGTTPSWFAASNTPIGKGAAFTADDDEARNRVVVLGTTTADNLFGDQDPIGQSVTIAGAPYTVVGVLKQKDSTGLQDSNDTIIAPLNRVRDSLAGYGTLTSIVVQAKTADTVNAVQAEVTAILDHALGLTSSSRATYRVLNQAQLLETQTQTADTFTVLLGAVAAISLLVGGIGVTNIMLVTVTERTREIGIRKALGPQRPAILGQFLAEATLLSLVGGLLGVIVGVVGSSFRIAGTDPVVVPGSIVLAFAVSAFIGLFFGSYPANRAARLLPIEALRYQ